MLHTRLSIIDIDPRSSQPMEIGPLWLVFNGECYNYKELRQQLISRGCYFRTESDTEVFGKHLLVNRLQGLDDCEGMWAFALYNTQTGELSLGRDRFGEKPLLSYDDNTGLYFGSEVKALAALRGQKFSVNTQQVLRYLVNGYRSLYKTDETFFSGVREVPLATVENYQGDGTFIGAYEYWQVDRESEEAMTAIQAADQVHAALSESVKIRLRSDRPLSFLLSGGIDSNALAAIARHEHGHEVRPFTFSIKDVRYDESDYLDAAIRQLGVTWSHYSEPVSHTFLADMRELVNYHDAPVLTLTAYMHWRLMRHVAECGYKVVVSGIGADELFTGYMDHHLYYFLHLVDAPGPYEEREKRWNLARTAWERKVKPYVRNPLFRSPDWFLCYPSFRNYLYPDAIAHSQMLINSWSEPFTEREFTDDTLRNRMMNELFHETVPVVLAQDDKNVAYFGLENRSPFLNRNLYKIAQQIPTRLLIQDGLTKAPLRQAVKGLVPDLVLDNPRKTGWSAPLSLFLDAHDNSVQEYLLDQSLIYELVQRDKIAAMVQSGSWNESDSKFLFSFLSAKMFLENSHASILRMLR